MNASSTSAATPASQPEAAEPSSKAEQQLPAQLRHRGHAEPPSSSEAAGDPMQPPQPGAATMSREARELSDTDADGKAAKLAAVARGQANSSEVHSVIHDMPCKLLCPACGESDPGYRPSLVDIPGTALHKHKLGCMCGFFSWKHARLMVRSASHAGKCRL